MRRFNSYTVIDTDTHYYAPRTELIEQAYQKLLGDNPSQRGHYLTVWGPRQSGKTWVMQEVAKRIAANDEFEVAILTMQAAQVVADEAGILQMFVNKLRHWFARDLPAITRWEALPNLFTRPYFSKPLILILDEFDALTDEVINKFAGLFRDMYTERTNEWRKPTHEKRVLLHGLALIGVRSVLGIENIGGGSPFNVQRSQPIPNLTAEEVDGMFRWYEREHGQTVDQVVIDRVFYETQGQPGLVGWLGEQLTEKPFNQDSRQPLDLPFFERVYAAAIYDLPNNNILNLISKVKQPPYRDVVLSLFDTGNLPFAYDDELVNFLYLHGVIDNQVTETHERYIKFSSPFIQKRLFNYFARILFRETGQLYPPFTDLSAVITESSLNVPPLLRLYERYLQINRAWLLDDVPVRKDLRVYEAVYHFNLYAYLQAFFRQWGSGRVLPEFPTGNGQIDLLISYQDRMYGVEVKSFQNEHSYKEGVTQAVRYAKRLNLNEIVLLSFIEQISDEIRQKYETPHHDGPTGITVYPIFIVTNPNK